MYTNLSLNFILVYTKSLVNQNIIDNVRDKKVPSSLHKNFLLEVSKILGMLIMEVKHMSAFKYKNPVYGYNVALFHEIFGENSIFSSLSVEEEIKWVYKDDKRTDEVDGYSRYFIIPGQNPFLVKFPTSQEIEQFAEVELVNPVACKVKNNVYFKAESVKIVKEGGK